MTNLFKVAGLGLVVWAVWRIYRNVTHADMTISPECLRRIEHATLMDRSWANAEAWVDER